MLGLALCDGLSEAGELFKRGEDPERVLTTAEEIHRHMAKYDSRVYESELELKAAGQMLPPLRLKVSWR